MIDKRVNGGVIHQPPEITMTVQVKLTATQTSILKAASTRPGGNIEPMPPALRGGVRAKVIGALIARGFVAASDGGYMLTDAGYAAMGKHRNIPKGVRNMDTPAAVAKPNTNDVLQKLEVMPPTVRPGTKLAILIDCLRQPGGTTVVNLMRMTHWQAHSVRGAISGIVKKKLGLNVISEMGANGQRVYRII